jgi:hypothetical protein
MTKILEDTTPDSLVADPTVMAEMDVSAMTIYRWDNDPRLAALGWPPALRVPGGRAKRRSRRALEAFKRNLLQRAIAERGAK